MDKLRENKNESYDDILRKVLYVLNVTREDPLKAKRILERISEMRERMLDTEEQEAQERKRDLAEKKKAKKKVAKT